MYMHNDNFELISLTMHKCFFNILGGGVIGAKRLKATDTTQPFGKPIISCHFDSRFNVVGIWKLFYCIPNLMQLVYSLKSYQEAARLQMLRVE